MKAIMIMCDAYPGKVLDMMDGTGPFWVSYGGWAKIIQPLYHEVAHTPLFRSS